MKILEGVSSWAIKFYFYCKLSQVATEASLAGGGFRLLRGAALASRSVPEPQCAMVLTKLILIRKAKNISST